MQQLPNRGSLARYECSKPIAMFALVLAAALLALMPATARAQTSIGTVTGTVRTRTGQPVDGAHVRATGSAQASALTDATGTFALQLPAGVYRINVTKRGYLPATFVEVSVPGGSSIPLQISLSARHRRHS